MSKNFSRMLVNIIGIMGIILCVVLTIVAWKMGILTSQEKMKDFITKAGIWGPAVFLIIQIIQVVVPIIPGGVSCLVGVLMFGALNGFLLNYIGICIGSMIAFGISKRYGRPFMEFLFSENSIRRYEQWTTNKRDRFTKLFALAILFPVAPDDLLCFLAGTTKMSWKKFNLIIWICKPPAIAMYSLGLLTVFKYIRIKIGG